MELIETAKNAIDHARLVADETGSGTADRVRIFRDIIRRDCPVDVSEQVWNNTIVTLQMNGY